MNDYVNEWMNEWMNIDCNRENRKLLKRISISDREELMEDMNLRAVFGRKWRFERKAS